MFVVWGRTRGLWTGEAVTGKGQGEVWVSGSESEGVRERVRACVCVCVCEGQKGRKYVNDSVLSESKRERPFSTINPHPRTGPNRNLASSNHMSHCFNHVSPYLSRNPHHELGESWGLHVHPVLGLCL